MRRGQLFLLLFAPFWITVAQDNLEEPAPETDSVFSVEVVTEGEFQGRRVRTDNPFNPGNILSLKEVEYGIAQTTTVEVLFHPWLQISGSLLGRWTGEGTWKEGGKWKKERTWNLREYNLTLADPVSFWEIQGGKLKRETSPGQVFEPGNLQARLSRNSLLQVGASVFSEWGQVTMGWIPGKEAVHDFLNPTRVLSLDSHLGYLEGTTNLEGLDLTLVLAWDGDWWASLSSQVGVGDQVLLYVEGVFWTKPWIRKAFPTEWEFRLKPENSVQTLAGISWTPAAGLGTFYVEVVWNSQGLSPQEWKDYRNLSDQLRAFTGPFVPLALGVYADHLSRFRFLEASAWYGALHWEWPRNWISGLEGGVTLVWSAPRDILVRGYASWVTDPGFFLKGEVRGSPWSLDEFFTLPFWVDTRIQTGWKLSF